MVDNFWIIFLGIINLILVALVVVLYLKFRLKHKNKINAIKKSLKEVLDSATREDEYLQNIQIENDEDLQAIYNQLALFHKNNQMKHSIRREMSRLIDVNVLHQDIYHIFEGIMPKIFSVTGSICGAFYLVNPAEKKLEIKYSLGFHKDLYNEFNIDVGDGYAGVAALTGEIQIIKNVPKNELYKLTMIQGFLTPKEIIAIPVKYGDEVKGVLIIATTSGYSENKMNIIEMLQYYIGIAVASGVSYEQNLRTNNELDFQNTLIQRLNNDLQNKIEKEETLFKTIADSIKDYGIYSFDEKGIILTYNNCAEELFGCSESEVIGHHVDILHTEDEIKSGVIEKRMKIIKEAGSYEESGWKFKKDGNMYYAKSSAVPMYDKNNELFGYLNFIQDATDLRNASRTIGFEEKFLKRMIDSSSDPMIVTDVKGRIKIANSLAEELLDEELTDTRIYELFLESYYLQKSLEDVASRYGNAKWRSIHRKTNKSIWFEVNAINNQLKQSATLFVRLSE